MNVKRLGQPVCCCVLIALCLLLGIAADDLDHGVGLLDRARGAALRANNSRIGIEIYQGARGSAAGLMRRRRRRHPCPSHPHARKLHAARRGA